MAAFPAWRRSVFFGVDRVRGGMVAGHARDVRSIVNDPASEFAQERRQAQLRELLAHAATTVPFYRDLGLEPIAPLEDLPVVDKATFFGNSAAMESDRYDPARLPAVHTSGSTGATLTVPRDPVKWSRHVGDLVVFGRMAGHNWGEPLVMLSVTRGQDGKRTLQQRFQGYRYVAAKVFDARLVEQCLRAIDQSGKPLMLVGSPSALEYVGRRLSESNRQLPPNTVKSVLAISEPMVPWLAVNSAESLGAPVVSRYSNQENGILAQQTRDSGGRYVVNHGSYVVELLDDRDDPVAVGEPGRIVVTDLYSRAVPLIRYDTGDLGRWSVDHPHQLAEIVGRRLDVIYGDDGQMAAPVGLMVKLWAYTGLEQYSFTQTGEAEYRLRLVGSRDASRDESIVASLKETLGPRARIEVEYCDSIPPMPSGKRRWVTNEWARRLTMGDRG